MAKRFMETSLITNPWFQDLTLEQKVFWLYLQLMCDHAGMWKVNWRNVKFHLSIEPQDPLAYGIAIKVLNEHEWYLLHFVEEQQGVPPAKLNQKNACHASIIKILNNKNILSPCVGPTEALARGYSNGNSNGKAQPYTSHIDSRSNKTVDGMSYNSYNSGVKGAVVRQEPPTTYEKEPTPDYNTPEWRQSLKNEAISFRKLGFTDQRIKELFSNREVPEVILDEILGRAYHTATETKHLTAPGGMV